jgi:hypothetical protein
VKRPTLRPIDRGRNDLERTCAYHGLQLGDHLLHTERFAEESAVRRPFHIRWLHLAGNEYDFDRGPALVHRMGEFQAVNAAWHLNVGK